MRGSTPHTGTKPPASFRPTLEALEERLMPARTYFILDYSPDYRRSGSLHDTFFNVRDQNGYAPGFFDFNRDGRLTSDDVALAANQITARVRGYYRNYLGLGLTIDGGDVLYRNTLLGHRWLTWGLRSPAQVSILYLGGRSVGGEFGRAPLAGRGADVEGFGEVYTRTIALNLWNRNPRATPDDFAREVASTAAHELGHMQGLHHAASGTRNNIMLPGRERDNNYFVNAAVWTAAGWQNAHHELWYSFQGQRTYYQVVNRGVFDIPPSDDHQGGCGCCCCTVAHARAHDEGLADNDTPAPAGFNVAVQQGARARSADLALLQVVTQSAVPLPMGKPAIPSPAASTAAMENPPVAAALAPPKAKPEATGAAASAGVRAAGGQQASSASPFEAVWERGLLFDV